VASPKEGKQVGVDLVFAGGAYAVGRAGEDLDMRAFDELGREACGVVDGGNLVVVPVKVEGWDVELPQVLGAVDLGEGLYEVVGAWKSAHHPLEPEGVAKALRYLAARAVGAIERRAEDFENCERSAWTAARCSSNTSIGRPPGFAGVLSIRGGTAPMRTALTTRFVPLRPM